MLTKDPKIVTAHQPTYLPWLGLFHKIAISDVFYLYDHVEHSKYDFTAKNSIKSKNGSQLLIVPIQKGEKLLRDIKVNNEINWRRKHWESIKQSYSKCKYFDKYAPFLEWYFQKEWVYHLDLCSVFLEWCLQQLGVNVHIDRSTSLNISESKGRGVMELSIASNADIFVFGKNGSDYADTSAFRNNKIFPYFQNYQHPTYQQMGVSFCSHLSIIDLLFNCGEESLAILLQGNDTKNELIKQYNEWL